jgi:hypothetical protein
LRDAGEDGGRDFDLPLEHFMGETIAEHPLTRFNRYVGRILGHTPRGQVRNEVFLFNAKLQVPVHRFAPWLTHCNLELSQRCIEQHHEPETQHQA